MARTGLDSTKTKKLHRDAYYILCAHELAKRDGLKEWPGNGPFWAECEEMTEQLYGGDDGSRASKYLPAKENRIAADRSLTHSEKVSLIHKMWEAAYEQQRAKLDAEMRPEQRERAQRNKEGIDAWLGALLEPFVEMIEEIEEIEDRCDSVAGLPVDVAERSFEEHLTDAGRIHAHSLGIRLD